MKKSVLGFVLSATAALLILSACGGSSGGDEAAVDTFTIGGTLTGLTGTGLVLQNNDGDDLTLDADGDFVFASELNDEGTYAVTVLTEPSGEACAVTDGSGTVAAADVSSVAVSCAADASTATVYVLIAADPNGDLYTIDETSGSATLLLDTSTDGTTDVGVVSSMLFFSDTDVLWLGTGGRSSNPCQACVMTLDVSTGVATMLADNLSANFGMPGMAMDSAGNIFSVEGDGDILVSVDSTTGLTTQIDPGGGIGGLDQGNGMTFDSADTLFVGNSENLYSVDTGTGAGTDIGGFTFIGFTPTGGTHHLVAMATRPSDGTIFGLLKETGSSSTSNSFLVTVNTGTAELTLIGQTDARYDGLEFIPPDLTTPNLALGSLFLYEDFSAGDPVDALKWKEVDLVNNSGLCTQSAATGALVASQTYPSPSSGDCGLEFVNSANVASYSADVTVTAFSENTSEGPIRARLRGVFYNDGTGANTGFPDLTGDVFAQIYSKGTVVEANVLKCTSASCGAVSLMPDTVLGNITLGSTHTLFLGWDGVHTFTFQLDDLAPLVFDASTAGATFAGQAIGGGLPGGNIPGSKVIELRGGSPAADGLIDATFDNIRCVTTGGAAC